MFNTHIRTEEAIHSCLNVIDMCFEGNDCNIIVITEVPSFDSERDTLMFANDGSQVRTMPMAR